MAYTWLDSVIQALQNLGGEAHLSDIYTEVKQIRIANGASWSASGEAVTRRTLETHSSDTESWNTNRPDVFQNRRLGGGVWSLRKVSNNTLVKERESAEGPDGSIVMRTSYERKEPEAALVKSFEIFLLQLKEKEFKPYSRVIPANGSVFRNDIFLDEVNFLIEAKIYTRENVRMVIGQIKDYARYCEPYPYCAALLSEKPDSELIDLLLKQDIYCIWKDSSNNSFDDNIPDGMLFS